MLQETDEGIQVANLLKLTEVAQRLDVSEKTVRRYVKRGVLPSIFVGNAYRVSEEDVVEYLRLARVGGEHDPKVQALPIDIDQFKEAAMKDAKPETLRELQALVEEAIEQRYSSTQLLTLKDELAEIRASLAQTKETHFDAYARVVEAENYVRRVLNKVAGRVVG
jgi:excisionase family DNA binding protein